MNNKIIINSEVLISTVTKIKNNKKKIVLCHGVFDLFHPGHLRYLKAAKKFGNILIVSITEDQFIHKGPGRPVYSSSDRLNMMQSLEIVDYVTLSRSITAEPIIKLIKPDVYAKGMEYKISRNDVTLNIIKEKKLVKKYGGKTIYIDEKILSSSKLINENAIGDLDPNIFLLKEKIKKISNFKEIENHINKFRKLKVMIIGETIIDNYIFCDPIGKSGKEPHLVLKDLKTENYMGGVIAIAKHIETFCKKVDIVSSLGSDHKNYLKKIKNSFKKNVSYSFIEKKNTPTILKKRYIDNLTNHKLIGAYSFNDRGLTHSEEKKLEKIILKKIKLCDLLIISDYGHGFISKRIAQKICSSYSQKIFLNAQLNAANYGYHTLLKYKKFNSLIINESELRHEMKDKFSKIENLIKKFSKKINLNSMLITRGAEGCILYEKKNSKYHYCPALASKVLDKVGAGDAMLALASLSIKSKLNPSITMLNSSIAAAIIVKNMGNSKNITKMQLLKDIMYFCK